MPQFGKTSLTVVFIIGILVFGILVALGYIPAFLPRQANLISVSQVNVAPGGSIQNGYVVNTYWNIAFTAGSYQSFVLELGPSNQSTYTGQTVAPSNQLFVTFTPQQPYLSVQLNSQFLSWTANSVSGYGGTSTNSISITCTVGTRGCGTETASGQPVTVSPQSLAAFVPSSNSWQIHYPMEVKVQQMQNGALSTIYDQTTDLYSLGANGQIQINGGASSGGITIGNLGGLSGQYTPPSLNDPMFFQPNSYTCAGDPSGWCGYDNGQSAMSGFQNYWFGTLPSYPTSSFNIPGAANSQYDCNSGAPPGWGQDDFVNQPGFNNAFYGAFYFPIYPQLVSNQNAQTTYLGNYAQGIGANLVTCSGQSLVNYLNSKATSYNGNSYGVSSWNIQCTSSTQCNLNETIDPNTMILPALTAQVSTGLVGTVIVQQNNAQFKFGQITSNAPNNALYGETSATVSVPVTDTSLYPGTAQVCYSQSTSAMTGTNCETQTIQPSQTFYFSFTVQASLESQKTTDTLTFTVVNQGGQTTDTSSITFTVLPVSQGSTVFSITSLNAPSSMQPGQQASVSVSIKNIGGIAGTAFISASSNNNGAATISPQDVNQSVTAGGVLSEQFTISAIQNSPQPVTFTISVSNSSGITDSRTFTISIGATCVSNCSPILNWMFYLGIVVVIVAAAATAIYFAKRKHS